MEILGALFLFVICQCSGASSDKNMPSDFGQLLDEDTSKVDGSTYKDVMERYEKSLVGSPQSQRNPHPSMKSSDSHSSYMDNSNYHFSPPDISPLELPFLQYCSDETIPCQNLSAHCLQCELQYKEFPNCTYGDSVTYYCSLKPGARCLESRGNPDYEMEFVSTCRFCYQTDPNEHNCTAFTNCRVAADPYKRFRKNCTVNHDVICLGNRRFFKSDTCDFSSGHKWSVAMILSVIAGGFGGDRFYLGHWQEGVGKLFSFGGLGVWTLVDIILVAIGYLRPKDGSLFIDYDSVNNG